MTAENKPAVADAVRARLHEAKTGAANVAKVGAGAIQATAGAVANGAINAKSYVDRKTRESLDKAYEIRRRDAVANLARIKTTRPKATPAEISTQLELELREAESKSGSDSEAFVACVTTFVLTSVELHDQTSADAAARQRLIDAVTVIDSKLAKNAAKYGKVALAILATRFGPIGKLVSFVSVAGNKVPWLKVVMSIAGIKNPGKKSAAWIVIAATRKVLGAPAANWPKTPSTATK